MFDANDDPLGISLKARASDRRFRYAQDHPGSSFGPLPDPKWDGFFQAMDEAGVSGMADNSVGAKRGMFSQQEPTPSTYDPRYQTSAVDTMPSNQMGVQGRGGMNAASIPSMDALLRITRGAQRPQDFQTPTKLR